MDRRSFLVSGTGLVAGSLGQMLAADPKADSPGPVVETSAGKLRGRTQGKIRVFRGIPYAGNTEGAGRFMPPAKRQPYYWQWYSPVRDGQPRAFHTIDIPFVFENVDIAQAMTGKGPERYALADKTSGAWAAFARSGNPNHPGIPHWTPFDSNQRATMIFNTECRAIKDPYRDERLARGAIELSPA